MSREEVYERPIDRLNQQHAAAVYRRVLQEQFGASVSVQMFPTLSRVDAVFTVYAQMPFSVVAEVKARWLQNKHTKQPYPNYQIDKGKIDYLLDFSKRERARCMARLIVWRMDRGDLWVCRPSQYAEGWSTGPMKRNAPRPGIGYRDNPTTTAYIIPWRHGQAVAEVPPRDTDEQGWIQ